MALEEDGVQEFYPWGLLTIKVHRAFVGIDTSRIVPAAAGTQVVTTPEGR